jgi:alkylation response protein AidB-like acyl-CoA dehydrogenase
MNLELSDEQAALRDTVQQFLAEKASVATYVRPLLDDPTGTTDEVWRGLAGLGATGLLVPAEFDGAGLAMVEAGIVAEQLGAALHPGPWLSCAVAATRALHRMGVSTEAESMLRGIADGSLIATVGALTGPRPVAASLATGVVLSGAVPGVPDAAAADVVLVLAESTGDTGLFAVGTNAPGVCTTAEDYVDQTRKRFRLALNDAPAKRLASASPDAVEALVDDVLCVYAADAVGAASAVMRSAIEYAKVRKQFGQPIGSFQAVQHLCVEMYETVELARSGVMHALWAADAANSDERHLAALRTKAFSARLATVAETAIQVFGGVGFTWEHDAHLYLKRLLSWSAFLGGADQYLTAVGTRLARSHAASQ